MRLCSPPLSRFMLKAFSEEWSAARRKAVPPLAQLAVWSAARSAAHQLIAITGTIAIITDGLASALPAGDCTLVVRSGNAHTAGRKLTW